MRAFTISLNTWTPMMPTAFPWGCKFLVSTRVEHPRAIQSGALPDQRRSGESGHECCEEQKIPSVMIALRDLVCRTIWNSEH